MHLGKVDRPLMPVPQVPSELRGAWSSSRCAILTRLALCRRPVILFRVRPGFGGPTRFVEPCCSAVTPRVASDG
jgi:hypothetical protein